ncbi:MAG: hypothetical protein ACTSQZ_05835 [Candidatus Thorarchaeota archaeon]
MSYGISLSIEVHDESTNFHDLLEQAKSADPIEGRLILSKLGAQVEDSEFILFKELANDLLISGTVDVTRWTRFAIKAAVIVCSERKLNVSLKNEDRTLSMVSFPNEGPLLEAIIDGIKSGEW